MTDLSPPSRRSASPGLILLGLVLVAFVSRAWQFGNPLIHPDEGFYLLAGERILGGTIPYAEIWDSKPMGLFLLYSAIRLLGGDGIVQYQIVATLFAAATAFLIYRMALRFAAATGAAVAAIAYLLYLLAFGGVGGQSQVFYNLIVAAAAWLTFRTIDPAADRRLPLRATGAGIMILLGICLQIKYSMVFEGIYFGLALLWRGWADGRRLGTLALDAALWIACALLPTGILMATFFAAGYGTEFMQGNFLSILGRDDPLLPALGRLALTIVMLAPFWLCLRAIRKRDRGIVPAFFLYWLAAAILGYLVFGSFYDHYTIPMLVPLAIVSASVLSLERNRRGLAIFLLGSALVLGFGKAILDRVERGAPADAEHMAVVIAPRLQQPGGCLYVYEGDPILYKLTGACLATRFAFPGHLSNAKHIDSMGFDTVEEVRQIMSRRPAVVVTAQYPRSLSNMGTRTAMAQALRADYRLVETAEVGRKKWMIFERVAPGQGTAELPLERPDGSGTVDF